MAFTSVSLANRYHYYCHTVCACRTYRLSVSYGFIEKNTYACQVISPCLQNEKPCSMVALFLAIDITVYLCRRAFDYFAIDTEIIANVLCFTWTWIYCNTLQCLSFNLGHVILIRYVKIQLNYSNNFVPFKHVPTLLEEPISRHSLVFACNFNVYKFRKLMNQYVVVWKKSLYAIRPLTVGL